MQNLNSLQQALNDLTPQAVLVEVAMLIGSLAAAYGLVWLARGRHARERSIWFGARIYDGVFFPVAALLVGVVARWALDDLLPVGLLRLAVPILFSLVLIRISVQVLRTAFPNSTLVRRLERTVSWLVWVGLVLWLTGLLPLLVDEMEGVHWRVGGVTVSLLMMVQQPNQTATEVLARQEEKLRLMGPHLGRIQAEFLDPLICRQFGIMRRANLLPAPPKQLRHSGIRIEYVSPLARAQRAGEGAAIVRALESLAPLGAIKPEIYDNIDADAAARLLAQSFGVPNNLLRTPDAVKKFRKKAEEKAPAPADGMAGLGDLGAMLSGDAASGGAA